VGVQRLLGEVVGLVPGDADEAVFDPPMDVVADEWGVDFRGPFVQGGRDAGFEVFRRAKLHLGPLVEPELADRLGIGSKVEASLDLTDADGGPRCASVRPPIVRWQVVPTEGRCQLGSVSKSITAIR
jgi:hypothetical protein